MNVAMWHYAGLVLLGFAAGVGGTLIGAGGAFVLVPLLVLIYPEETPAVITTISLTVVFFNAVSGSVAYAKVKRIDYVSALVFAATVVPGSIIGALVTTYLPRRLFDAVFGVVMLSASTYLFLKPKAAGIASGRLGRFTIRRTIVDAHGERHDIAYDLILALIIGFVASVFSGMLGIGGGIIRVAAMVSFLNFPVHIAAATAHLVTAIMAFSATGVHFLHGDFAHGIRRTIALVIGVLPGAQLGAYVSNRVRGASIIRGLAIAMAVVGLRIFVLAIWR